MAKMIFKFLSKAPEDRANLDEVGSEVDADYKGEDKIHDSFQARMWAPISSRFGRFTRILRGHLQHEQASIEVMRGEHRSPGAAGAVLALLSLLVVVAGATAMIAFNQVKVLKSDINMLERQVESLKKQAAISEQRRNSDEKNDPSPNSAPEKSKNIVESRTASPRLVLSPDETRLIRDYIKPAPPSGPTAPPINVGDQVTVGTVPLPSPLTDKIPKLLGARFAIRDGAIIIVTRDSHQADAVLGPN